MRSIQVFFSDGDHLVASINGSDGDILEHYLGHRFEAGSDTEYHVAILVKFLDTETARGLRLKNIESGAIGRIRDVRVDTVKIDDTRSSKEVILTTVGGSEYSIEDCWIYQESGDWIQGIGYAKATA